MGCVIEQPEVRIGTAERERAYNALGEHFSAGRLDVAEFEERSGLTAVARTSADLAPLFSDLPGGLPAAVTDPQAAPDPAAPRRSTMRRVDPRIVVAIIVMLVAFAVVTGHGWVLFLLFPVMRTVRPRRGTTRDRHPGGPGHHHR